MTGRCHIYQARNGLIYFALGGAYTVLTEKQVNELHICVYELEDFDYDLFKTAYQYVGQSDEKGKENYIYNTAVCRCAQRGTRGNEQVSA